MEPNVDVAASASGGEVSAPTASVPTAAPSGPGLSEPGHLAADTSPAHRPPTEAEAAWMRVRTAGHTGPEFAEKVRTRLLDDRVVLRRGAGDVVEWEPCPGFRAFPP